MLAPQSARQRSKNIREEAARVRNVKQLRTALTDSPMSVTMSCLFWRSIEAPIPIETVPDAVAVSKLIPRDPDLQVWRAAQTKLGLAPNMAIKILDTFESHGFPSTLETADILIKIDDLERLRKIPQWVTAEPSKAVRWIVEHPHLWNEAEAVSTNVNHLQWDTLAALVTYRPEQVAKYVLAHVEMGLIPLCRDIFGVLTARLDSHQLVVDLLLKTANSPQGNFMDLALSAGLSGLRLTASQLCALLEAHPNGWQTIITSVPSLTADVIDEAVAKVSDSTKIFFTTMPPQLFLPTKAARVKYIRLYEISKYDMEPELPSIQTFQKKTKDGQVDLYRWGRCIIEHCLTETVDTIQDHVLEFCDAAMSSDLCDLDILVENMVMHATRLKQNSDRLNAVFRTLFGCLGFHTNAKVWVRGMYQLRPLIDTVAPDLYRILHEAKDPLKPELEHLMLTQLLCRPVMDTEAPVELGATRFEVVATGAHVDGPVQSYYHSVLAHSPFRTAVIRNMIEFDAPNIARAILHVVRETGFCSELVDCAVTHLTTLGQGDQSPEDAKLLKDTLELLERRFAADFGNSDSPIDVMIQLWDRLWLPEVDWKTVFVVIHGNIETTPACLVEFALPSIWQRGIRDQFTSWFSFERLSHQITKAWITPKNHATLRDLARFIPSGTWIGRGKGDMLLYQEITPDTLRLLLTNPRTTPAGAMRSFTEEFVDTTSLDLLGIMCRVIDDDAQLIAAFIELFMLGWTGPTDRLFARLTLNNAVLAMEELACEDMLVAFTAAYHDAQVADQIRKWIVNRNTPAWWGGRVFAHAVKFKIEVTPDLPEGAIAAENVPKDLDVATLPKCYRAAVAHTEEDVEIVDVPASGGSWF